MGLTRDDGRIEVWSEAVADPVAVRSAWADNPVCDPRSTSGLPVTPFRADDFPGRDRDGEVEVIVRTVVDRVA